MLSNSKGRFKKDQYIIVNQNCDLINDYSSIYCVYSIHRDVVGGWARIGDFS